MIQPPAEIPGLRRSRIPLTFTVILGGGWIAGLVWLTLATANPVTLNWDQLQRADALVHARVEGFAAERCRVVRNWKPEGPRGVITVRDLHLTGAEADGEYLLPLSRSGAGWRVTPTRLPDGRPLIYPATAETMRQLERVRFR